MLPPCNEYYIPRIVAITDKYVNVFNLKNTVVVTTIQYKDDLIILHNVY